MDFKEKAARDDLRMMQEKIPELKNFSEEEQVQMIMQTGGLDMFGIISIIGILAYLGIAISFLFSWHNADAELGGFGATMKGLVWFIALPMMIPVFIFVGKVMIPRRVKKLRTIVTAKTR
ncbi:MAG: hypothetical protein ACRCY3_14535 [Sphingorhabdus sp.]